MLVNVFSLKKDGNTKLSTNFKVKEFKCNDGSDVVFICPELVIVLQQIRNHFGKAVNINSGYRTVTYNKKVGGENNSQHTYGTGADIYISGVKPSIIADYAESLMKGWGGIGTYDTFVHIDVRTDRARWKG